MNDRDLKALRAMRQELDDILARNGGAQAETRPTARGLELEAAQRGKLAAMWAGTSQPVPNEVPESVLLAGVDLAEV